MKRKTGMIALLLVAALLIPTTAVISEEKPVIGILQYVQHPALDAAREGFIEGLKEEGFVDGENITIDYKNGQAAQDIVSSIADGFVADGVDLMLGIATPAVLALAGKTETIPILGTAVTDYVSAKLVESNEAPGFNVSGTTDMNPVADQIALIKRLLPEAQTLGLLFTGSEINSQVQAEIAKTEAEKLGMKVEIVTVSNSNDVQQAAMSILGKCDVLYVPTDNIIASSIALVSAEALERKIPIAVGEEGMVMGGGTFTLGINYFNLGKQTGKMAAVLLRGEKMVSEMPIESQTEFSYMLNKSFFEEIGLEVPEDLQPFLVTVE